MLEICAPKKCFVSLFNLQALNALEGRSVREGVKQDLSGARREIASTIRSEIGSSGNSDAKRGKKRKPAKLPPNKTKPQMHSKLIKRKKAASTLLD